MPIIEVNFSNAEAMSSPSPIIAAFPRRVSESANLRPIEEEGVSVRKEIEE